MDTPVEGGENRRKPLSLRRNFSWTFIGNLVYAAAQWGMIVVLARLSPADVGQFRLALGLTAPIILLTNLQLRGVQASDAKEQYTPQMYLALRIVMTLLGLLGILVVALSGYADRQELILVILLVGLAKGAEAISDVLYGYLQHHERMEFIAKSMMIKGIASLILMAIVVYLTKSMVWGAMMLVVSWTALLIFYDMRAVRQVARDTARSPDDRIVRTILIPQWDWQKLAQLAWLSFPLGLVLMLISLNANIPVYYMEQYHGEAELGIFGVLSYFIIVITTIVQALGQSATPRMANFYQNGQARAFISLLIKMLGLGCVLAAAGVIGAWIAGREVLLIIFGEEYAAHADLFVLVMLAGGIREIASFAGYAATAARYFRSQTVLFAIVALATLVTSALWIPEQGSLGAVWSLVVTGIIQLAGSLLIIGYAVLQLKGSSDGEQGYA